jgi:hypothetical protein
MRHKLSGWDHTAMRDFEARLPRHQLDLRQPYGTRQRETLLGPREARGAAEAEQSRVNYGRARFLQDLSAESLLPGFIAFGAAPRPAPSLAVLADQHNIIVCGNTESVRSMCDTIRINSRRKPGDQPIAAVRANRELLTIARYRVSRHCHLHFRFVSGVFINTVSQYQITEERSRPPSEWVMISYNISF